MTNNQSEVSKCCGATVILNDNDVKQGQTYYYLCEKCGLPCDIVNTSAQPEPQQEAKHQFQHVGERETYDPLKNTYYCKYCHEQRDANDMSGICYAHPDNKSHAQQIAEAEVKAVEAVIEYANSSYVQNHYMYVEKMKEYLADFKRLRGEK